MSELVPVGAAAFTTTGQPMQWAHHTSLLTGYSNASDRAYRAVGMNPPSAPDEKIDSTP